MNPDPVIPLEWTPDSCQRWRGGRTRWVRSSTFNPALYRVAPISAADARHFVIQHHYSATMPAAIHHHGLIHTPTEQLVGVAVASVPVSRRTLTNVFPTLQPYAQSVELGRFVLLDDVPANAETWTLARVLRCWYQAGVRGVVSFADPMPRVTAAGETLLRGHWGTIYQAAGTGDNYTGRGTARTLTLLPDGTILNARAAQKVRAQETGHAYVERRLEHLGAVPKRPGEDPRRWLQDALATVGASRVRHRGPHRYVFPLGRSHRERSRIPLGVPIGLPYPKRLDPPGSPAAGKAELSEGHNEP